MTVEEAERWTNSKRRKKHAKASGGENDDEDVDSSSYEWSKSETAVWPLPEMPCAAHSFSPMHGVSCTQWPQVSIKSGSRR